MSYDWQQLEQAAKTPILITDNQSLANYAEHWLSLPLLSIDTEFIRTQTFYPIPGLIQVADDHQCYLLDPLSIEDFRPLIEVFRAKSVLKIIHAGCEDLELFERLIGVLPEPILDTQIAAALLNWGFSVGLQRLLKERLDVEISKAETTSDWLQRPLSNKQKHYAALDVAYLAAIYKQQQQLLKERGLEQALVEESQALINQAQDTNPDGTDYYLRFSQMWKLSEVKLAGLRDLTTWREQTCKHQDLTRNRVLSNQALLDIILAWPSNKQGLAEIESLRSDLLRKHHLPILNALKQAQQSAEQNPAKPIAPGLPYTWKKPMQKLKAEANALADKLQIAPEILLRKKELEYFVRSGLEEAEHQLPVDMPAWRRALLNDVLLAALDKIKMENS